MRSKSNTIMQNSIFLWIALAVGVVLLIPLVMMQFSSEVDWHLNDFIIMSVLLFGVASLFVLGARRWRTVRSRVIAAIILAVMLLFVWAELAVGVFTNLSSS